MVELEALVDAAKAGDEVEVRALVAAHPDLTVQRLPSGDSPLMAALYRGHHSVVNALVELGAEVDVFAAAATGRITQLERELFAPGAARTYSYDGWTALHLASFFGHVEAVRMLLQAGADIESVSRNNLKNTALHAATAGKHVAVALLLLEWGADAEVVDGGGHTANRIASENQLTSVLAAMAKPR